MQKLPIIMKIHFCGWWLYLFIKFAFRSCNSSILPISSCIDKTNIKLNNIKFYWKEPYENKIKIKGHLWSCPMFKMKKYIINREIISAWKKKICLDSSREVTNMMKEKKFQNNKTLKIKGLHLYNPCFTGLIHKYHSFTQTTNLTRSN